VNDLRDGLYVLGGLAVALFFIVRQRRSGRFRERSLLFPIGLGIYGVVLLSDTSKHHALSVASAALLFLSAVASLGFGVFRGRTIELFVRGGELWERASWTTIGAETKRDAAAAIDAYAELGRRAASQRK
jgi:hypothetical protein